MDLEPKIPSFEREDNQPSREALDNSAPKTLNFEHMPDNRVEAESKTSARDLVAPNSVMLPPPVVNPLATDTSDSTTAAPQDDDMPIIANDDDLIEKEWVDKAKKILAETKDDPYKREQQIGVLQADYLKKRYGRVLGNESDRTV